MYTDEQKRKFIEVLKNKNGHIGKACDSFGIHRSTYYDWIEDEWFAEEVKAMEEREVDDAEEMHRWLRLGIPKIEMIDGRPVLTGWEKEPDRHAIEFYLERKGRMRGWQQETKIAGTGARGEIVIVKIPDNGRDRKELPQETGTGSP